MWRFAALVLTVAMGTPTAVAQTKVDPQAVARAVAPYLDDRTLLVGHLDLTHLDVDALLTSFARLAGMNAKELAAGRVAVKQSLDAVCKAGGKDAYCVFSLVDLFAAPFFIFPVGEGGDAQALAQAVRDMGLSPPREGPRRLGNAIVAGSPAVLDRLSKLKPTPRPELLEVLKEAGETSVGQIAFLPTRDDRRILEETLPNLPPQLGGGSIKAFTQGVEWLVLSLEAAPTSIVRLTIQTPNAAAARELSGAIMKVGQAAGLQKDIREALPNFDKLVQLFTPTIEGDRLTLVVEDRTLVPVLQPTIVKALAGAARGQSSNNLKQLGLAMHNYHDTYGRFPAIASYDKTRKKPLLSWRVHLLPFLDQDRLYQQFHLDEPWDSEHNKKLIDKMPKVYQSSTNRQLIADGKTTYLAPVGKSMDGIMLMFAPDRPDGVRIADVSDGTSHTIFLVDAGDERAVLWTKPDDLEVAEDNPAKDLAARDGGYLTLFVDGSVRVLSKAIDRKTLWALFTRNGGEVVDDIP
jgi:hypothetical protein